MLAMDKRDTQMRKILVTAFDPFGGASINPALEAVKQVTAPVNAEITKLELPTVFFRCVEKLEAAIIEHRPDAIICVGQAAGRKAVTPETTAVNIMNARIPDNIGFMPKNIKIDEDGPNKLHSTLPVMEITENINKLGIPSEPSDDAGTFVCNFLFYKSMQLAEKYKIAKCGFIHVPCIPSQLSEMPQGTPAMEEKDIVSALNTAVSTVLLQ